MPAAQLVQIARFIGIGLIATLFGILAVLIAVWFKLARRRSVMQPGAPRIIAARTEQTTTVLADGRVLVAGGTGPLRSAEVYDPVAGIWSPTASLATGRYGHTATLLPDGRVLVAGGSDGRSKSAARNALRSVEIYDPNATAWTPGAPMLSSRWDHTAAALPDGRILVTGGIGVDPGDDIPERGLPTLASSEVYDPKRDMWTPAAPMHRARMHHFMLPLPDGRVVVLGGHDLTQPPRMRQKQVIELYDPANDSWRLSTAEPIAPLDWVAMLPDGTVFATGYLESKRAVYDPLTDTWRPLRTGSPPLSSAVPVMLPGGLMLLSGGMDTTASAIPDAVLFDPSADAWMPTGSMGIARGIHGPGRYGHIPVVLSDGTVLVYGGRQARNQEKFSNPPNVVTSEVYDPASGTWSPLGRQQPTSNTA